MADGTSDEPCRLLTCLRPRTSATPLGLMASLRQSLIRLRRAAGTLEGASLTWNGHRFESL